MSETEFVELDGLPLLTVSDEYSVRRALVDSMLALGIQHSRATGLTGRILGLHQPPSRQSYNAVSSSAATWPGFEYFHRCRECMRTDTEVTLDALRCHVLMALYLMKGNAFRDAYNLLGITVRKAYIAKLHRLPPSHLPDAGKDCSDASVVDAIFSGYPVLAAARHAHRQPEEPCKVPLSLPRTPSPAISPPPAITRGPSTLARTPPIWSPSLLL